MTHRPPEVMKDGLPLLRLWVTGIGEVWRLRPYPSGRVARYPLSRGKGNNKDICGYDVREGEELIPSSTLLHNPRIIEKKP